MKNPLQKMTRGIGALDAIKAFYQSIQEKLDLELSAKFGLR